MILVPIWFLALVVVLFVYLLMVNARLHKRVKRLENIVRRLEGTTDEEVKNKIREKMR